MIERSTNNFSVSQISWEIWKKKDPKFENSIEASDSDDLSGNLPIPRWPEFSLPKFESSCFTSQNQNHFEFSNQPTTNQQPNPTLLTMIKNDGWMTNEWVGIIDEFEWRMNELEQIGMNLNWWMNEFKWWTNWMMNEWIQMMN